MTPVVAGPGAPTEWAGPGDPRRRRRRSGGIVDVGGVSRSAGLRCGGPLRPAVSRPLHSPAMPDRRRPSPVRRRLLLPARPKPMTGRCKGSGPRGGARVPRGWLLSVRVVVPGHARHRTRRRPGNGGSPSHDQANPVRVGPRGLARRCGRRLQHPGRHDRPNGDRAVNGSGVGSGRLGSGRLGRRSVAERLLAFRGQRPGSSDPGRFHVRCAAGPAARPRRRIVGPADAVPVQCACNPTVRDRWMPAMSQDQCCGSAPASSGGEPSKTRRSGTLGRSGIRPGQAVRQCGAGRDDDVDSAASVCPGPFRRGAPGPVPSGCQRP